MTGTESAAVGPSSGQTRRSLLGLAWLSLASGCIDVLSFLKLGDLFASAMTGNSALFAIALARGEMLPAARSLTALVGFMLGASLATLMHLFGPAQHNTPGRLRTLLLLEMVLLGGGGALWSVSSDPIRGIALYSVIMLCSLSMGIQGVAARHINVAGISSVVFTSVLISMVVSITGTLAGHASPSAPPASTKAHIATFAAYLGGAALAALMVSRCLGWLVFIPMAAVFLALCCWEVPYQRQRSVL